MTPVPTAALVSILMASAVVALVLGVRQIGRAHV